MAELKAALLDEAARLKKACERAALEAIAKDPKKLAALGKILLMNLPKTRAKVDWRSVLKAALPIVIDVVTTLAK